jgi:proteasome lid subunit RPN8/RPN11
MIRYNPKILRRLSRLLSDVQIEQVAVFIGQIDGNDFYVEDVLSAVNESCDTCTSFFVSNHQIGQLMIKAQRRGSMFLGIVHTHLRHHPAAPSQADFGNCKHAVNAVFHPSSGRLTFFDNNGVTLIQTIDTAPVRVFLPGLSSA